MITNLHGYSGGIEGWPREQQLAIVYSDRSACRAERQQSMYAARGTAPTALSWYTCRQDGYMGNHMTFGA